MSKIKTTLIIMILISFWPKGLWAELREISDQELSEVSAQAAIRIDNYQHDNNDFIRINLGLDIETQINMDKLEIGRYHRWENGAPCFECDGTEEGLEKQPADILVNNFSLGHIDKETGEIQPFKIKDPYLEFALDSEGAPTGVRIGFGKSKGWLSGDIQSLTGNINIALKDNAYGLAELAPKCSEGHYSCLLGFALKYLGGPLLKDSPLITQANLINDQGQLDPVRATMVGMQSGEPLSVDGAGEINFVERILLDVLVAITPQRYGALRDGDIVTFHSSGCDILTVNVCFPFKNFGSFELGRGKPEGADGLFISFQNTQDAIQWAQSFDNDTPGNTVSSFQETGFGGFFNIPNAGVQATLNEAMNGIPRKQTEFIDRGVNLF